MYNLIGDLLTFESDLNDISSKAILYCLSTANEAKKKSSKLHFFLNIDEGLILSMFIPNADDKALQFKFNKNNVQVMLPKYKTWSDPITFKEIDLDTLLPKIF